MSFKPEFPSSGSEIPWMIILEIAAFILMLIMRGTSEANAEEEIHKKYGVSREEARRMYREHTR